MTRTVEADILDGIGDAFYSLAPDWTFTFFNREAETFFGFKREDVLGRKFPDVFPKAMGTDLEERFKQVMLDRTPVRFQTWSATVPDHWLDLRSFPLSEGGIAVSWRDETERKSHDDALADSLHRQEVLYRELNHRVTNSLQAVIGMLRLSNRSVKDLSGKNAVAQAIDHVTAMSLVHKRLYRTEGAIDEQNAATYISGLCRELTRAFHSDVSPCAIHCDVQSDMWVQTETIMTIGLLVSELVMNSIKHASCSSISVVMRVEDRVVLTVSDDGIGLSADFDPAKTQGLGMRLVHAWARQLKGTMDFRSSGGGGMTAYFTFPANHHVRIGQAENRS